MSPDEKQIDEQAEALKLATETDNESETLFILISLKIPLGSLGIFVAFLYGRARWVRFVGWKLHFFGSTGKYEVSLRSFLNCCITRTNKYKQLKA